MCGTHVIILIYLQFKIYSLSYKLEFKINRGLLMGAERQADAVDSVLEQWDLHSINSCPCWAHTQRFSRPPKAALLSSAEFKRCRSLGHVPLIDHNPRGGEKKSFAPHEAQRSYAKKSEAIPGKDIERNYWPEAGERSRCLSK